jgi:hypothetical protein
LGVGPGGNAPAALDVAQHGQEVIVLLGGEGAEAALGDVAAAVVVLVVAADVGGQQPHHVVAQVAVGARPEDQVEVIRQQAVGEEADRGALAGLAQQVDEGGEVAVLVEEGAAAVAPVEDVVTVAALGSAGVAWHGGIIRRRPPGGK